MLISNLKKIKLLINAKLTGAQRKKLSTGAFAYPEKRAYPINDASHVRAALQRYQQFKGNIPPDKRAAVLGRILSAARKFGINVDPKKFRNAVQPLILNLPSTQRLNILNSAMEKYLEKSLA